jgi:hypothetical protein
MGMRTTKKFLNCCGIDCKPYNFAQKEFDSNFVLGKLGNVMNLFDEGFCL